MLVFRCGLAALTVSCLLTVPAAAQETKFATAATEQGCLPRVEAPDRTAPGYAPYIPPAALVEGRNVNEPPPGYVAEEFFLSCDVEGAPYKTLVHVIRPADPKKASGVVLVEPWHMGNNWSLYSKIEEYLARSGHAAVMVVANPAVVKNFFAAHENPIYRSLILADRPLSGAEILAHTGAAIKLRLVPGLAARYAILGGHSNTGAMTRRYIHQEHGKARLGSNHVFDGYFPMQAAVSEVGTATVPSQISDIDVPVIEIQGERELIMYYDRGRGSILPRRDDGPLFRLYEIPGMSHEPTRGVAEITNPTGDPNAWSCVVKGPLSSLPHREIFSAALDNLVRWIVDGVPAPHAPRIATADGGRTILRDEYGNARGGMPVNLIEVPVSRVHSIAGPYPDGHQNGPRCDWVGVEERLPEETLRRLYPSQADYAAKAGRNLDALVKDRWLLAEDALSLRDEAANAAIP